MSSSPSVSVVVPALNAERWISETVASVSAQKYPAASLEVVLVDDGSSDGTSAEASRSLSATGLAHTLLRHESPMGPSAARNRGWKAARGEWIQFLDADDLIHPNKIAIQMASARSAAPDIALVFSRWARLRPRDGRWEPAEEIEPVIEADPTFDLLRADNFIATGSQLFRRSWLERVTGYVDSYRFIEDVDLLLRLAFAGGGFLRVPSHEPLFWYRQTSGSLANSDGTAFVDGCVRNARMAESEWRKAGPLKSPHAALLADVYYMGAHHYASRDAGIFRQLVDDIHRLDPHFAPKAPSGLRALAKVVGYAHAERVAVRYRRLKRSLRGAEATPRDRQ